MGRSGPCQCRDGMVRDGMGLISNPNTWQPYFYILTLHILSTQPSSQRPTFLPLQPTFLPLPSVRHPSVRSSKLKLRPFIQANFLLAQARRLIQVPPQRSCCAVGRRRTQGKATNTRQSNEHKAKQRTQGKARQGTSSTSESVFVVL